MYIGVIVVAVIALALVLLEREIFFYEGVHLGPRVQSWLYDRWAAQYDQDKRLSQSHDSDRLAQPLLSRLASAGLTEALVLDVATGTGRLPYVLLQTPAFQGRVIALDISTGMLSQAATRLAAQRDRVTLLRHGAERLPFPDAVFDAVGCLEALELMADRHEPLAELARVLRPGGVLITSRGTEASGRIGQVHSVAAFTAELEAAGFEQVEIQPWWRLFDLVWARKPGQLLPHREIPLAEVLCCELCRLPTLVGLPNGSLRCQRCDHVLTVNPQGIIVYPL